MKDKFLKLGWIFAALVLFATIGCEGPKGSAGTAGTPAVDKGSITGVVTESETSNAITGATVATGSSQATTDSAGNFIIADLPIGVYKLTVSAEGYNAASSDFIGIVGGQSASVNFSLSKIVAANQAPVVSLASQYQVGYSTIVTLTAVASDPNNDPLTYSWSGTGVVGSGATATITIPSLVSKIGALEDRFGLVGIAPSAQASYSPKVTVSDGMGGTAAVSATVTAASTSAGIKNVPVGLRIYVNSGHNDPNSWTCTPSVGGSCSASGLNTRTLGLTPTAVGTYTLTEGGITFTIYAGTWQGVIKSGSDWGTVAQSNACSQCHPGSGAPDKFTPWSATKHATIASRGLDGQIIEDGEPHYTASCLRCHTVGYDAAYNNGGFDDVMASTGWAFPATLQAGNVAAMPPALRQLLNIQCENCHGPQVSASGAHTNSSVSEYESNRITFSVAMCAQCHDRPPGHAFVDQWRKSGHANIALAQDEHSSSSCARCHAGQGFVYWLPQVQGGNPGNISGFNATLRARLGLTFTQAQPQVCAACHSPHNATNEHQLRVFGTTPRLPSGFIASGLGSGALCTMCHNSRNGVEPTSGAFANCNPSGNTYLHEDGDPCGDDPVKGVESGTRAPHTACQSDVFMGRNAYFMGPAGTPHLSKHANVEEACVGCHMILNPDGLHAFKIDHEKKADLCANCHGNTTGEGLESQVEGLLEELAAGLAISIQTIVNSVGFTGETFTVTPYYFVDAENECSAVSAVSITPSAGPITIAKLEEVHGRVGVEMTLSTPVAITLTGSTTVCQTAGTVTTTTFLAQTSSMYFTPTVPSPTPIIPPTDWINKAGWNFYLIEGDGSHGVHNPSFVVDTLWNTIQAEP